MNEGLNGIRTVFLDSAPLIYFVEGSPTYFPVISPVFELIDQEKLIAFTSPITLAECIHYPRKNGNASLEASFERVITNGALFVDTNLSIAKLAADVRASYELTLTDAIQVASALFTGCDAILTNDMKFRRVREIKVLLVDELKSSSP